MSEAGDVPVVWVDQAEGRDDARGALAGWARAHGLTLHVPAADARTTTAIDPSIAERVEKELTQTRDALAALDADASEQALARADALLRAHPELPQAAWLRAEVHRGWAARWARVSPRDDLRAQEAWQDADALDGGRAGGVGEISFPSRPKVSATLTLDGGEGRSVVVYLDGVELASQPGNGRRTYPIEAAPAEHHLVVSLDGETAFAEWVAIAAKPSLSSRASLAIAVRIGDGARCSAGAFERVKRDANHVRADGVSCDRWVAAAAGERRGTVFVARCERSACGPLVEWRNEATLNRAPPPRATDERRTPWAAWTAVGLGAVAATTLTLIAVGAFESRPSEPRFVTGGVRTE